MNGAELAAKILGDIEASAPRAARRIRRRRQIIVLAELVLSPRVLIVLAAIVILAGLGLLRNLAPGNPCSPGYHESTANLLSAYGPCRDVWHRPQCLPSPGVPAPRPTTWSLPSCVQNGGPR